MYLQEQGAATSVYCACANDAPTVGAGKYFDDVRLGTCRPAGLTCNLTACAPAVPRKVAIGGGAERRERGGAVEAQRGDDRQLRPPHQGRRNRRPRAAG